jgi:hypothetical protein
MKRLLVLVVVGIFLLAACGDSGDDEDGGDGTSVPDATETQAAADPTTVPTDVATEEPTAGPTEEAMDDGPDARPDSAASAALSQSYNSAAGGSFDAAVMGFGPGDVEAQWYQADGFYVVVYAGLDLAATGPLCPGNSIQTAAGFEFVSNAPTDGADCSTFPTISSDPAVGALVCGGVLSYRTAIPATSEGVLYGTIERPVEGGIMGITSTAPTSAGVPEVDIALLSC